MKEYRIKWLDTAVDDLESIGKYLLRFSSSRARAVTEQIRKECRGLDDRPKRFPVYEDIPMLRKMVVDRAVVLYFIHEEVSLVQIYHIAYSRQDINLLLDR